MSLDRPPLDRDLVYAGLALGQGLITAEELEQALRVSRGAGGRRLVPILLERRAIGPGDHERLTLQLDQICGSPTITVEPVASHAPSSAGLAETTRSETLADQTFTLGDTSETSAREKGHGRETLPAEPTRDDYTGCAPPDGATEIDPEAQSRSEDSPSTGATAPRFRAMRLHARGGLGEVHEAWDQEIGRRVALKRMRPDLIHNRNFRARFLLEAEINGNLEHPGIVPVYGLGVDRAGAPYYAMRFVEGQTLQAAIEHFHQAGPPAGSATWILGLRQLLGSFLDVCNAIAFAHSRGILHRDLKPSNVMLGAFGETHIIDWGLAKPVGRSDPVDAGPGPVSPREGSGITPTMAGQVHGSPYYMSPEQAAGAIDELDASSDVFSLGATLYCVLVGRAPFQATSQAGAVALARAARFDPPRTINPDVPPALEAICVRAMRRERAQRYPDVMALAADLKRWLADEPVSVHRDPPVARLARWARWHRSLVTGAAALVLTATVALGATTIIVGHQRNLARAARDDAQTARVAERVAHARAEAHVRLGLDLVDQLVTLGDRQLVAPRDAGQARQDLLRSALGFLKVFRERKPDDTSIQSEAALVARRLGHLQSLVGRYDEAEPSFTESVTQFNELVRRQPNATEMADQLAEAQLDQAELWLTLGRARDALAQIQQTSEGARTRATARPGYRPFERTLARSLYRLGQARFATGDRSAAEACREAVDRLQRIADPALSDVRSEVASGNTLALTDQLEWAIAQQMLANILAEQGHADEAEATLRQTLDRIDLCQRAFRDQRVPDLDYFSAVTATQLGLRLLERPGGRGEARFLLDGANELLVQLVDSQPGYMHFRIAQAEAHAARARLHEQAVRPAEARAEADAARKAFEPLVAAHLDVPDLTSALAEVLDTSGRLNAAQDRRGESLSDFQRALELQEQALRISPEHPVYQRRRDEHRAGLETVKPHPAVPVPASGNTAAPPPSAG